MGRQWKSEAEKHAFFLSKKVDEAVRDHDMIRQGDRILVGVSGGKDSLSLLRLLTYRLQHSQDKYDIVAAHVCGDARGVTSEADAELQRWIENEGVVLRSAALMVPEGEQLPMDCERCSRARRHTLFEIADAEGCNKIALGHNIEDFAATALINLFSSGMLETMAFKRVYFGGRFAVIRPLAYIREKDIVRFARACGFPVAASECPLANTSRRAAARELMARVSHEFRQAAANIVKAASGGNDGEKI